MSETGIIGLQSTRFVDIGFLASGNRLRSANDPPLLFGGLAARSRDLPEVLEGFVPRSRILAAFVEEEGYDTHVSRAYTGHRRRLVVLNELLTGMVITEDIKSVEGLDAGQNTYEYSFVYNYETN